MVPTNEAGRYADDVEKYNAVAIEVMKKYNVSVNDLNRLSQKVHPKYGLGNDNVHYTEKGYEILAAKIIHGLKKAM